MTADSLAGGVPARTIGTEADLMLRHVLSKMARRRARRLAMHDGHPAAAVSDAPQPDDTSP